MKKKRTKPITAAELMDKLGKNRDFQKRKAEQEQHFMEKEAFLAKEQKQLVAELKRAGMDVQSVWDLVNTGKPYPQAIPVLLRHLKRDYSERTKEGIARALAVPEAKDAWDFLLEEFEKSPDNSGRGPKWGLGCALSVIAGVTRRYEEVLRLLRDKRHGAHRIAFTDVLASSKNPEIRSKLEEFVDDPVIGEQVRLDLKHPGRRRS